MTISQVKEEVVRVIRDSTEAECKITMQTHLVKSLGLSSVEIMMLVSDLEDRFGVSISSAKLRNVWTVGDLCNLVITALK